MVTLQNHLGPFTEKMSTLFKLSQLSHAVTVRTAASCIVDDQLVRYTRSVY